MSLIDQIDRNKLPQHVAIIMDGNGRWAKLNGKERTFGHKNALKAVRASIECCRELGIKYLTLYAFSTENWNRPKLEVAFLMTLLSNAINKEIKELHSNNIRLNIIGDLTKLPSSARKDLQKAIELTKNNTGSVLTLALSYGSKEEIIGAIKTIANQYKEGKIIEDDITEELVNNNLYTHNMPMVDLMIRTSGETRISNFLLWQIAYAELYFTPVLWPDFTHDSFYEAILCYQRRERRFGKISEQLTN
ncbi:isoprenyl transferase [Faecalibacter rhinopitheci]|uniref:Isoprenyl transferase n=1 Tax=Faecalibacter rhinopitheci TaxID=2779678 RepID=A0A8J7FWI4_9FLAO|nr:isoprenyl transferase [Faecalibacter rhinopitheci]MBF0596853.1 isoprenyl transferase [Faecalibacter rhinopitheci]MBQ0148264.1 isoprenyl transferase [Candidatus Onthonaster equi]